MEENVYLLNQKPYCQKHPTKFLEYLCLSHLSEERSFCSTCIFQKDYPRNIPIDQIKDLSEFLFEEKVTFQMKGLSSDPEIFDYLIKKTKRESDYTDIIYEEYMKFEQVCENLVKQVVNSIDVMKRQIQEQIDEFKENYMKTSSRLVTKISENFNRSYMAQFQTFQQVINSQDVSNERGLNTLLEQFIDDRRRLETRDDIQKIYNSIVALEQEIPSIDFERFDGIKSYFNVFYDKLQQAGTTILTIRTLGQVEEDLSNFVEIQREQDFGELPEINPTNLRKIACSGSFPTDHTRSVYSVIRYSNNQVLTGSDDGTIQMFDCTTMECEATLRGHLSGIRSLVIISQGYVASASYDKTIKIWNLPAIMKSLEQIKAGKKQNDLHGMLSSSNKDLNPYMLRTFTGHLSSVLTLRYVGENQLASGSSDYTVKVWDLTTGEVLQTLSGHMNDVLCLAGTQSLGLLCSGSADKSIKVWNLTQKFSSACLQTLTGHTDFIWTMVLGMDELTLFSGSIDKTIQIWNIDSGQLIQTLDNSKNGHIGQVTKILLYAESILISSSVDMTIKFWDLSLNVCVHTLVGHQGAINSFCIMPDRSIMSSGADKMLCLWD